MGSAVKGLSISTDVRTISIFVWKQPSPSQLKNVFLQRISRRGDLLLLSLVSSTGRNLFWLTERAREKRTVKILTRYAIDGPDGPKYPDSSYCRQVEIVRADCVLHRTNTRTHDTHSHQTTSSSSSVSSSSSSSSSLILTAICHSLTQ